MSLFGAVSMESQEVDIFVSQILATKTKHRNMGKSGIFGGRGVGVDTKNLPNQDVDT